MDDVTPENLVPGFVCRLNEFRTDICAQLREPMLFEGQPVTCALLAELGPLVAKAMNEQGVLSPASLFEQVEAARAQRILDAFGAAMHRVTEELEAAAPPPARSL